MHSKIVLAVAVTSFVVACSTAPKADGEAPAASDDGLASQQMITDGNWTMVATTPSIDGYANTVSGTVDISYAGGPATRPAGACLLNLALGSTGDPIACNSATDCSGVPLPTGGVRYCVAPDGTGAKSCFIRPGTQSGYCSGSPAMGGTPVGPGAYTTPTVSATVSGAYFPQPTWVLYGCFAGCATIPGSVSPSANRTYACSTQGHYWDGSSDTCFDTTEDYCASVNGWWGNNMCYTDYDAYACETQSTAGTMCASFEYRDGTCHCVM